MKKKFLILSIAVLAVAALGLTAFSYAQAAGAHVPVMQANGAGQFFGHPDGERGDGPLGPYVQEATAGILGISIEELQTAREDGVRMPALIEEAGLTVDEFRAALEAALPDIVAQALADEAITEAQANFILENGLKGGQVRFGPLNPYVVAATADFLGMDVDEFQAALEDGTTLDELLETAGLTHLELRQALDNATPDIVQTALDDEVITQDQADHILEYGLPLGPCGPGHRGHGPGGPGGLNGPGGNSGPNG